MSTPSPVPVRFPSGVSTDFPYGPLANMGQPNPFMYHTWEDDFDVLNPGYTATKTSTGTIAVTAGNGGLLLFTTAATSADLCSIQLPTADFAFVAGKKNFFLTRLQVSDAVNAGFVAGLIETTTTPGTVTDGVYFYKASGAANNLVLNSMIGSVLTSLTIPTSAYSLTNATNIDLGFYIDRKQNVYAFVGAQLVGYIAQSGSGSTTPVRGACAAFAPSLTTANLNPTLAVLAGTASAKTMTADFMLASEER